jgi:hypothetical protein
MINSRMTPDSNFTAQTRTLGSIATWMTFAITEVYAIVSGVAYASQGAAVESGPFLSIMALLVVLMGPFLVLSMSVVHIYAIPRHKAYSLAALGFMIACVTITSCINFLLFMVSSQPDLFSAAWRSLFLPCKWPAPAFILDNFIWDWFFGISMLLATPIFSGDKLKNFLRIMMILSGSLCILGLVWIAIAPAQAVIIGILGWGAAGPIVFLLLARVFGRIPIETRADD